MIAIAVPVYYLCKPGQAAPYDWFPYAALGIVVVSVGYGIFLHRRDPTLGERAGSIVADESAGRRRSGPSRPRGSDWMSHEAPRSRMNGCEENRDD